MPTSAKRPSLAIGMPSTTMPAAAATPVVSVMGTAVVLPFIVNESEVATVRSPLLRNAAKTIPGSARVPSMPAAVNVRGGTDCRSNSAWLACGS